jgi:hypothetical protein
VTQHDTNPTDASRVARQGREHAILGVRAGLGLDRVVTDDGNPIHAQDKRKVRANSWKSQGPLSNEADSGACFEKKGAASG